MKRSILIGVCDGHYQITANGYENDYSVILHDLSEAGCILVEDCKKKAELLKKIGVKEKKDFDGEDFFVELLKATKNNPNGVRLHGRSEN